MPVSKDFRVEVQSDDLPKYLAKLRKLDKRALQNVIKLAMRSVRPFTKQAFKAEVEAQTADGAPSRNNTRLKDIIQSRIVARPQAAPGVLLLMGARGRRLGREKPNQIAPKARLYILRGTVVRFNKKFGYSTGRVDDREISARVRRATYQQVDSTFRSHLELYAKAALQY